MKRISEEKKNEIIGIIFIVLGIINLISLYKETGYPGDFMRDFFALLFGKGSLFVPLAFFYLGYRLIRYKELVTNIAYLGFFIVLLVLLTFIHMAVPGGEEIDVAIRGAGGGLLGGGLLWLLRSLFTQNILVIVILLAIALSGLLLMSEWDMSVMFKRLADFFAKKPKKVKEVTAAVKKKPVYAVKKTPISKAKVRPIPEPPTNGEYMLPPTDLLQEYRDPKGLVPEDQSDLLENTLANFGIEATVINITHGPRISRYELQPAPGIKVSRIVNLADDIALALAAPDIRIEAPIPGKAALGIEVPHKAQKLVGLRELVESANYTESPSKLSITLGKDISGEVIVEHLNKMPHLLIAGATGTGKSMFINSLILSILFKATPEQVKMVLIDPKQVELTTFKDLPHLILPLVNKPKNAAAALQLMVEEMERRYDLFAREGMGVRSVEEYNKLIELSADEEEPKKPLPLIVIIIDELADLMMISPREVEDSICRLAQMARAAGIYLVIATQRPSVDVITGLIKVNIPTRISFYVTSQIDSRTIIDMGGAEKLMGEGDMLFSPVGVMKPIRIQAPFVTTAELKKVVGFVKKQIKPDYQLDLKKIEAQSKDRLARERDELYEEAVALIVENEQASISVLQRRFNIGYNRAGRMIDMMERDGIIGPFAGSKSRKVFLQKKDLPGYLEEISE